MEQDGEGHGLDDDADVGGDGKAFQADAVKEQRVDRDGDEGDDPSGGCGGDGVACGVEGARVDSLGGPEGDGEGEESEGRKEKMENQIPMNLVVHSTLLQSYVRSNPPRPPPPLFTTGHVNIVCIQPQPQPHLHIMNL